MQNLSADIKTEIKRMPFLDVAKAILIILVILGHTNIPGDSYSHRILDSFHMPAFFIISGFLMAQTKGLTEIKFTTFLFKKLKGIMYPYVTLSVLSVSLVFIEDVVLKRGFDKSLDALYRTVTLQGYFALWFLPTLLFAEVLTFVTVKFMKTKGLIIKLLFTAAVSALVSIPVSVFWQICPNVNVFFPSRFLLRGIIAYTFVIFGFQISPMLFNWLKSKNRFVAIIISFFVFAFGCFLSALNPRMNLSCLVIGNPALFYLFSLVNSFSFLILLKSLPCEKLKFLNYIGKNTIIIMAIHVQLIMDLAYMAVLIPQKLFAYFNLQMPDFLYYSFVVCVNLFLCMIFVFIINRYFKFVLKIPTERKKV